MKTGLILLVLSLLLFSCQHTKEHSNSAKIQERQREKQVLSIQDQDSAKETLENLEATVDEVRQFFTHRDKVKKTNYFLKASGVLSEKGAGLFFYISPQAEALGKEEKIKFLQTVYGFWKYRSKNNGLGKRVSISILNSKGKLIAENVDRELKVY